ncbi:MAG TPA: hypothetical protein VLJ42_09960 [Solirubrobacteraceae bacterium]|nr:hypothetical protein [Solirubrobacteraceae bacterium]
MTSRVQMSLAALVACACLPMSTVATAGSTLTIGALLATSATLAQALPAQANTSAIVTPSLAPNRLGAKAALSVTISFKAANGDVPAALRRSLVHLPAGLNLDIPSLRSCTAARLRAHGPGGCPPQSQIGRGRALVQARAGSQLVSEHVTMWVFLGPLRGSDPTVVILARGYTPFDKKIVLTGRELPDQAPYGDKLLLGIPPIHTLRGEPDASIVSFSLTLGAAARRGAHTTATSVIVPSHCPPGGFPFAAEFTYADGSASSALTTSPCPQ